MAKPLKAKGDTPKVDVTVTQPENKQDETKAEQTGEVTTDASMTDGGAPEETTPDNTADDSQAADDVKQNQVGVDIDATPPSQQINDSSPKVDIDVSAAKVDETRMPKERVKIRLRTDHSCTIAKERYDFKAGEVYTVPRNVKTILSRADLLSPL